MTPTRERFRALARSSPWRWRTVRFTATSAIADEAPVRGWIRRPGAIRVERLDGTLLKAGREMPPPAVLLTADGQGVPAPTRVDRPAMDADGLVAQRSSGTSEDPMYRDYRWVAMLDPVELADGVAIEELTAVEHHGRPAWEALMRPSPGYEPTCSCCALLYSRASQAREAEAGVAPPDGPPERFPEAHRVRLDVETGLCVLTEEIGGSHPGRGHDTLIEAVDEAMPDRLFLTYPAPPGPLHGLRRRIRDRRGG